MHLNKKDKKIGIGKKTHFDLILPLFVYFIGANKATQQGIKISIVVPKTYQIGFGETYLKGSGALYLFFF